jgi:hypothetical protein
MSMESFDARDILQIKVAPDVVGSPEAKALERALLQIAATRDGQILLNELRDDRTGWPLDVEIRRYDGSSQYRPSKVAEGKPNDKLLYNPKNLKRRLLRYDVGFLDRHMREITPQRLVFHELYHAATGRAPKGEDNEKRERNKNEMERRTRFATNKFMKKYYDSEFERSVKMVGIEGAGYDWQHSNHRILDRKENFRPEGYHDRDIGNLGRLAADRKELGAAKTGTVQKPIEVRRIKSDRGVQRMFLPAEHERKSSDKQPASRAWMDREMRAIERRM